MQIQFVQSFGLHLNLSRTVIEQFISTQTGGKAEGVIQKQRCRSVSIRQSNWKDAIVTAQPLAIPRKIGYGFESDDACLRPPLFTEPSECPVVCPYVQYYRILGHSIRPATSKNNRFPREIPITVQLLSVFNLIAVPGHEGIELVF